MNFNNAGEQRHESEFSKARRKQNKNELNAN